MPFFQAPDRPRLYYADWGDGKPVVFVSSWALSSTMWEYQMVPLSRHGLRCIALDRRGHGRSDDPGRGYDFDTLAEDLNALLVEHDLRDVTLVGHSMGCCEVARFLLRHGTSRIARVALVSPTTPYLLQAATNPEGAPRQALDGVLAALTHDRPRYFADNTNAFFGIGSPASLSPIPSDELIQWGYRSILESSPLAIIECMQAMWETDFRPDMLAFTVPTLIIHGTHDKSAPIELCGYRTARAIAGSQLTVYEGAPHGLFLTHKERLNTDLLAFIHA